MDGTNLFSQVQFYIAQCDNSDEVKNLLISGDAKQINYLSERVTHVIADSNCPAAEEAADLFDKPVVTSLWVHLSLKAKRILPFEAFSPFRKIFQNVVASFSQDLSQADISSLAATVTYHGGRVTGQRGNSTHFIVATAKPTDTQDGGGLNDKVKVVAPDWILESVKQNACCDESLFEHTLLLSPPPPPPPKQPTPPPPTSLDQDKEKEKSMIEQNANNLAQRVGGNQTKDPTSLSHSHLSDETPHKIDMQASHTQIRTQSPSHTLQYQSRQQSPQYNAMQVPQQVQMAPRTRMAANIIRNSQPRPRQTLPTNITQPRHHAQLISRAAIDDQQPRKALIDTNSGYRKASPYSTDAETQHMQQQPQPLPQYQQHEHQQGVIMSPNHRNPPPNMYHPQHPRPAYPQNSHMPPRMISPQQMQRFRDPNSQMPQPRSFPVPSPHQTHQQQPPIASPNYQQGPMQRQPVYYNQNMGNSMRMPQQGSMSRPAMAPNEHQIINETQSQYSNPNQPPQSQQIYVQQQHLSQPTRATMPPQPNHPFQQPHPPIVAPSRLQFAPSIPNAVNSHPTRGPRQSAANHLEPKSGPRHVNAGPNHERAPRGPRAAHFKTQPHPSIFDLKQDSSYSQIKAKVPDLTDSIEYFNNAVGYKPPTDRPFMACKFKLIEHEDVSESIRDTWREIIASYGGSFSEDMDELTHVICETQTTPTFKEAIDRGIRCVTMYWIKDVIGQDRLEYPWKALHVPIAFELHDNPLKNQIITTTNFSKSDRGQIKKMIELTGGRYTDFMSSSNTLLICGKAGGEKFERAVEWRVSIANCQLLTDFLISGQDFSQMLDHAKYQNFKRSDQLRLDSYALIRKLMEPWTKPIPAVLDNGPETNGVSDPVAPTINSTGDKNTPTVCTNKVEPDANTSQSNFITENGLLAERTTNDGPIKENVDQAKPAESIKVNQEAVPESAPVVQPEKTNEAECNVLGSTTNEGNVDCEAKILDESQISVQQQISKKPKLRTSKAPVRILTTRLTANLVTDLKTQASKLGLGWATNPKESTHLLVESISRSPNFVMAFSHASYILSYKWLVESHEYGQLLDEKAYILQDSEGEIKYSFNLVHSLLNRSKRPGLLFDNFIFFVTPSVTRRVKDIERMIDSAGGRSETKKLPSRGQLAQIRAEGKRFVVVTYRHDYHLLYCVEPWGIDIVDAEFVISGILRQEIDFEAHRLNLRNAERQERLSMPISNIQPSPMKRLRQV